MRFLHKTSISLATNVDRISCIRPGSSSIGHEPDVLKLQRRHEEDDDDGADVPLLLCWKHVCHITPRLLPSVRDSDAAFHRAGPHFFLTSEKPHYQTAFRTIMICYALVVVEALGLRFYLAYENRRRDMVEGALARVPATVSSDEDLTDKQTVGMRYRL